MPLLRPKLNFLIPVGAWALSLACPTVPQFVWLDILNAINNGDVLTAELVALMATKGVKLNYAETDFPNAPPQIRTPNNLNQ